MAKKCSVLRVQLNLNPERQEDQDVKVIFFYFLSVLFRRAWLKLSDLGSVMTVHIILKGIHRIL